MDPIINTDGINLYREMLENIDVGVYFVDNDRQITFWNKGAEEITGFMQNEVVGAYCYNNILNHVDEKGTKMCLLGCPLKATTMDGKTREQVVYLHHKDGHRLKVKVKAFPIREDGKIVGAVEIFESCAENEVQKQDIKPDIADSDYTVEELKVLALYDQLTGLPNRRYLESIIKLRFSEYEMIGIPFGILFIDIDNFRVFNNTYGHDIGDKVLKTVATTYGSAIRKQDYIGRWGGEEFIGIFPMVTDEELRNIAEKIRMLVEYSVLREKDGKEYNITISVGGTVVKDGDDIDSIVKRADEQMYISKENGKNRVTII